MPPITAPCQLTNATFFALWVMPSPSTCAAQWEWCMSRARRKGHTTARGTLAQPLGQWLSVSASSAQEAV